MFIYFYNTPFRPYIALISVFCPTDGAARILPWFHSFYLPNDKYSPWCTCRNALCERESAHGGGTWEDRSTINFGRYKTIFLLSNEVGDQPKNGESSINDSGIFDKRVMVMFAFLQYALNAMPTLHFVPIVIRKFLIMVIDQDKQFQLFTYYMDNKQGPILWNLMSDPNMCFMRL